MKLIDIVLHNVFSTKKHCTPKHEGKNTWQKAVYQMLISRIFTLKEGEIDRVFDFSFFWLGFKRIGAYQLGGQTTGLSCSNLTPNVG